jgi:signal transduction histidine kinase
MGQPGHNRRWLKLPAVRTYWISRLAAGLVFPVVAIRKLGEVAGQKSHETALILLACSFLLYLCEPFLVRRNGWLRLIYYLAQGGLILGLGWLRPYEDTWALLYLPLTMSAWYENPRPQAILWSGMYAGGLITTHFHHFGAFEGLGYTLTYISACFICISSGNLAVRAEKAQAESAKLLRELQEAHDRLADFARQAEKMAAAREQERLVRELHDSVSQMIFSITLATESTRLLLQKDAGRVPEQLNQIHQLTSSALSRMRALIGQWQQG